MCFIAVTSCPTIENYEIMIRVHLSGVVKNNPTTICLCTMFLHHPIFCFNLLSSLLFSID